ncbi:hypothetical protein V8E36_006477 [Tilletia maclaganii]
MHFSILSLALMLATVVPSSLAVRQRGGKLCSTTAPANATREAELAPYLAAEKSRSASSQSRRAPRIINVYFHVIHSGSTGKLSGAAIQSQLRVLNKDYQAANYQFKLINTTYTNNNAWFTTIEDDDSPNSPIMKKKLRKGGKADLNLYTVSLVNDVLGFATFPWDFEAAKPLDGVVIHTDSLPTNSTVLAPYNRGRTATHEIGHWMGLYHPFEGESCDRGDPGDYVSDTPQQSTATSGCPFRKDSCTKVAGLDATYSFMDYTDDACMQRFSTGQGQRMNAVMKKYRGI